MKLRDNKTEVPSYIKRDLSKTKEPKKATKEKPMSIHKGHRERLKSQYVQNGINTMTEVQQLELLLFYAIPQKDTNPIAHNLLNKFGSIKDVLSASIKDLQEVEGVKLSTATYLKLISNMTTAINMPKEGELVSSSAAAKEYCKKFYTAVKLEQFHVVCLSKNNKVLGTKMIKSGTTDQITVDIRDITEFAMSVNCNRIIVSHNHPVGKAAMSDEDCRFTYSLICSCLLNSIEVLDHIIVGDGKAVSLYEMNIIEKLKARAVKKILIPKDTALFLSSLSENYEKSEENDFDINIEF